MDKFADRRDRQRSADQIALQPVTSRFAQPFRLLFRLNPLGGYAHVEAMSELNDTADDCLAFEIALEIRNEIPIDLYRVERECL